VAAEGDDNGRGVLTAGPLDQFIQQVLVPEVHTVEAADTDNRACGDQLRRVTVEFFEAAVDVGSMGQGYRGLRILLISPLP
jgi:hypothetical protein